MLDAVSLEKKGIHTVTIVWDTFERAAKATARMKGVPDAKFVVTPARKGGDTLDDQRDRARVAVAEIVRQLLAARIEDPVNRKTRKQ
ncbi:MAG TPA: hypothetical protein VLJ86_25705 [Ramlibacter sp.]|nr:hypothetical protein [Ramlibacter sp.]